MFCAKPQMFFVNNRDW